MASDEEEWLAKEIKGFAIDTSPRNVKMKKEK